MSLLLSTCLLLALSGAMGDHYVCQYELFREEFQAVQEDPDIGAHDGLEHIKRHIQHLYTMISPAPPSEDKKPATAMWLEAENKDELFEMAKGKLQDLLMAVKAKEMTLDQAVAKGIEVAKTVQGPAVIKTEPVDESLLHPEEGKCYVLKNSKCKAMPDFIAVLAEEKKINYNAWTHNCVHFVCTIMASCGAFDTSKVDTCFKWFLGFDKTPRQPSEFGLELIDLNQFSIEEQPQDTSQQDPERHNHQYNQQTPPTQQPEGNGESMPGDTAEHGHEEHQRSHADAEGHFERHKGAHADADHEMNGQSPSSKLLSQSYSNSLMPSNVTKAV